MDPLRHQRGCNERIYLLNARYTSHGWDFTVLASSGKNYNITLGSRIVEC
jgi:hypothetical protein